MARYPTAPRREPRTIAPYANVEVLFEAMTCMEEGGHEIEALHHK